MSKALTDAGFENESPDVTSGASILSVGKFRVFVYGDEATAKKTEKRLREAVAPRGAKARVDRHGARIVVAPRGQKLSTKQRKQFDEISAVVADA